MQAVARQYANRLSFSPRQVGLDRPFAGQDAQAAQGPFLGRRRSGSRTLSRYVHCLLPAPKQADAASATFTC